MALAEHDDSIETLLFDGPHKPFCVGVQIRASRRQFDRLDTAALQYLAEGTSEEWIPIMNQVPRVAQKAIDHIREIPSHLLHPLTVRLRVDACDLDSAALQFNDKQYKVALESLQGEHFNGEQVGCRHSFPVSLKEGIPGRPSTPFGSRFEAMVLQDPLHGIAGDLVPEVDERSADSGVAPLRILCSHPHYKIHYILWRHRSTSTSPSTAIVLLGDQPSVPTQNRVGRDNAGYLCQRPPSESLAAHCESAALGIAQSKRSAAKLLAEDPILFSQVVDLISLVAVQPPGQRKNQEVDNMGHAQSLSPNAASKHQLSRRLLGPYLASGDLETPISSRLW